MNTKLLSLPILISTFSAISCTTVAEQKCGPSIESMPDEVFKESEFVLIELDSLNREAVLRYRSARLSNVCTYSETSFDLLAEGSFDIDEARVKWKKGDSELALSQDGNRFYGSSVPRYFDIDFDRGPAVVWVEVDFRFEYTGTGDLEELIDQLALRTELFEVRPNADMHL